MLTPDEFRAEFQARIEAFLASSGLTPTTFGKECTGDPGFVFDVRAGRKVSLETAYKVLSFIEDRTPADSESSAAEPRRAELDRIAS